MTLRLLGADRGLTPDQWREEQYAAHRAEYATLREESIERESQRPRKNAELALSMTDRLDVLTFRGVTYDVPTLPYADGFEMSTLWGRLTDLSRVASRREQESLALIAAGKPPIDAYTPTDLADMLALLKRAVTLFWRNVRVRESRNPFVRAVHRVRAAWRAGRGMPPPNEFLTASETEVGNLFSFFFACRTRSSVRHHPQETASLDRSIMPKT